MVVLDTNIIFDHLRRKTGQSILEQIAAKHSTAQLGISILSIQELYSGQSTTDAVKEQALLATVAPLTILPYTYQIAQVAGEFVRDCPKVLTFADAAIAATTVINQAQLLTLNFKDFVNVEQLELIDIPSSL